MSIPILFTILQQPQKDLFTKGNFVPPVYVAMYMIAV